MLAAIPSGVPAYVVKSVNTAIGRCIAKAFGLKSTDGQKELELARQRWFRDLTTPTFNAALADAVQTSDSDFFTKLGQILNEQPLPLPQPLPPLETGATFDSALIYLWLPGEKPSVGFCQVSDPLIADCLNVLFNRKLENKLSPTTVRKRWERLGLKKITGQIYTRKSKLPPLPRRLPEWGPSELIRPS